MSTTSETRATSANSCTSVSTGTLNLFFNFSQNPQSLFYSRPAKAANRRAICFVVAGFEDERKAERLGDAFDNLGHANGVLFALNHARTGDQKKIARSDAYIADLEGGIQGPYDLTNRPDKIISPRRHRGEKTTSLSCVLCASMTPW